MATFEIQAPDGKTYRIEGADQQGALSALQQHLGAQGSASPQASTATPEPVASAPAQEQSTPQLTRGMSKPFVSRQEGVHLAQIQDGYTVEETDRGRFMVSPQGQWTPIELDGEEVDGGTTRRALEARPNDPAAGADLNREALKISMGADGAQSGGLAANFVAGAPFVGSYFDEAVGGVANALGGDGEEMTDRARDQIDAYSAANPGNALAANVGGAITGSIPMAVAGANALAGRAAETIGGRALQALGVGGIVGGVEGAVYGYGRGETGAQRRQNARTGGAMGAGLGAGLGVLGPYIAAGGKKLIQTFRRSDTSTIARELGVSRDAAAVIRQAIDSGDEQAAENALRRAGDSAMLADANSATRQLVDTAAQMPGDAGTVARRAVNERTQAATGQMNGALDGALGPSRGIREIQDGINSSTQGARSTAYDEAYAAPIDYSGPGGRRIEALLARVPDNVVRRANELMRVRGEESAQIIARIGDDGRAAFETLPDVRQLDYITRALNDIASQTDGAGRMGGQTALGGSLEGLSRNIRQTLRSEVPAYGNALDVASDAISQRNASITGERLLTANVRREDVARSLQGASASERDAMKQGVRSYIDEITSRVSRTASDPDETTREGVRILRDLSSRGNREKLRMVLGPDADALLSEVDEAAVAFQLRAAIADNSKTAARQATQGAVRDQTSGGVLRTLMSGEYLDMPKVLTQSLTGENAAARVAREANLYREMADALVNTRGRQAQRALNIINRAIEGQTVSDAAARFAANTIVGALGSGGAQTGSREASTLLGR